MKCDCKILGNDHDEWCSSHPMNKLREEINVLREQIETIIEASSEFINCFPHSMFNDSRKSKEARENLKASIDDYSKTKAQGS